MGSSTGPRPMEPRGGLELNDGPDGEAFEIMPDLPKEGAEDTT